jgi:hypothetical protein
MFEGEVRAYPSEAPTRLGRKGMLGTNSSFFGKLQRKKGFMTLAHLAIVIKAFFFENF